MSLDNSTTSSSPYEDIQPVQGVILGLIATPGIIANALTIIVTLKLLRQQKMTPNIFVLALACMDMSGIVISCFPTWLCYIFKRWVGGQYMCKFQGFMTLFFSLGSGFLATSMSVDRYVAVKYPLYHRQKFTVKVVKRGVLGMVMASALILIFPVVGFGSFVRNLTGTYCTLNWFAKADEDIAFSCLFAAIGIVLVVTVVFCNINIATKLYRRESKLRDMRGKRDDGSKTLEKQFAKMMIVISIIFLICWTPFVVRIICNLLGVWISWSADLQSTRLLLLNLVLDPFTYVITRKHYRKALWSMLCGRCRKTKATMKPNSSLTSSSRNLRLTNDSNLSLGSLEPSGAKRKESKEKIDDISVVTEK